MRLTLGPTRQEPAIVIFQTHAYHVSSQVSKLCLHYGPPIGHIGGEAFHDFPKPEALIGARVESHLRELGFGYRAKYIAETAKVVATEKPAGWLDSLRNPLSPGWGATGLASSTYKNAHEELLTLAGVGPKVADCVCLMGLGWAEAVPVDTHVWQIAQRDYRFAKTKSKTLNKALYDAVGDHFRKLWGAEAGWAHSVLFTADLRTFSEQASGMPKETSLVEVKEEVQETMHTPQSPSKKRRRRTSSVVADKKDPLVETAIEEPVVVKRSRRGARR